MKHDPTTDKGMQEIKKSLGKLGADLKKLKNLSEKDLDGEPNGKLTNPSEIQIKRTTTTNDDR